jgi:hypothetical protein
MSTEGEEPTACMKDNERVWFAGDLAQIERRHVRQ